MAEDYAVPNLDVLPLTSTPCEPIVDAKLNNNQPPPDHVLQYRNRDRRNNK